MADVKNSSLATDLVSYWELEEASGTRVDSHGSNDLTDNNTVGQATGKIGDAADFEASQSERLIASSPFTTATTDFSVSMWFKPESIGAYQSLMQNGRQSNFWNILIHPNGRFQFFKDNIAEYPSTFTLAAGTWYHLVIVKTGDGANNMAFFVNNAAAGTASVGTISTPATAAYLGAYTTQGTSFVFHADGIIDEVGIWSKALTSTERSDLYNSGAGIPYDAGGGGGGAAAQAARRGAVMMM